MMATAVDSFSLLFQEINKELNFYEEIFAIIGIYFVGKNFVKTIFSTFTCLRVNVWPKIRGNNLKRYGGWAGM